MKHESRTIIIDVDGVLVAHTYYDATGERLKSFHSRDNRAIKQMVKAGYRVILMTASSWPGIYAFAEKVGAEVRMTLDKMKTALALDLGKYIAIADDETDLELLKSAEIAFVPGDHGLSYHDELKKLTWHSGESCVAEMWAKLSDSDFWFESWLKKQPQ